MCGAFRLHLKQQFAYLFNSGLHEPMWCFCGTKNRCPFLMTLFCHLPENCPMYTQIYSVLRWDCLPRVGGGRGRVGGLCSVQPAQLYAVTQYLANISQVSTSETDNKQDKPVKYLLCQMSVSVPNKDKAGEEGSGCRGLGCTFK